MAWGAFANAQAAVVLQVDANRILTGALNVNVGGQLYDVQFIDGTCASVYSGCDAPQDFAFTSDATATVASQALLDQVLLDGAQGSFDEIPSLTRGCILSNDAPQCYVFTATSSGYNAQANDIVVAATSAYNSTGINDFILGSGISISFRTDFSNEPSRTWAVWTIGAQTVDEPGVLASLGIGLLGMILARRRRVRAARPGSFARCVTR